MTLIADDSVAFSGWELLNADAYLGSKKTRKHGETLLHIAARHGHTDLTELLLRKGTYLFLLF